MKNAKQYETKFKGLIKGFKKAKMPEVAVDEAITHMVLAILRSDASDRQAEKALQELQQEYVDFNELRVSQAKEIVECIGTDYPDANEKAYLLGKSLNAICDKFGALTLEPLAELNKREIRKILRDFGMGEFTEAYISMTVFGIHAFPVDISLTGLMEVQEYVAPDAEITEVQGFLERVVSQKDAYGIYVHLREHVSKHRRTAVRSMEKRVELRTTRRLEEMKRRIEEEQRRKMQEFDESVAAAAGNAQAAKQKAAAKAKAADESKQDTSEDASKAKAKKESAEEKPAKKTVKTKAKKAAKKAVKKTVKKAAKKTAKKATKKVVAKKKAKKAKKK